MATYFIMSEMKKHIVSAFVIILLSCPIFNTLAQENHTSNDSNILRIATFNIQNFGKSKLAKTFIVDTLSLIIRHFDIVAVQEISDISNTTAGKFLKVINKHENKYRMACSPRTGKQTDDKTSAEQYVFYYNQQKLELVDTALYDDRKHDYFQREPWIAQFRNKISGDTLTICTIHTMPARAVKEIEALQYVAEWIPQRFQHSRQLIICGDFNAGCAYASPDELDQLPIRHTPYQWLIPDNYKTNLSKSSCAYDRFVTTNQLKYKVLKTEVYHFFKSKTVSDHWPVYIELQKLR